MTKSRFIEQQSSDDNLTLHTFALQSQQLLLQLAKSLGNSQKNLEIRNGRGKMFGNWKLAANFGPLGRLRWLMEGSRHGYLGVALSAKRSAMGLQWKLFRQCFISQKTNLDLRVCHFFQCTYILAISHTPGSGFLLFFPHLTDNFECGQKNPKEPQLRYSASLAVVAVLFCMLFWPGSGFLQNCPNIVGNLLTLISIASWTGKLGQYENGTSGRKVRVLVAASCLQLPFSHCWAVEIMTAMAMGFNGCSFPMAANFRNVVNLLLNLLDPKKIIFCVLATCIAINDDLFLRLISIHRIAGTQDSLQLSYDSDKTPNWP